MKLRQAGFEDDNYDSLDAIAKDVNTWCHENSVIPQNGQAAQKLTVRNLRFYRTQGLLDAPLRGRKYGQRHFIQLTVIRVLQAQGLPLNKIRELMYAKSDAELHALVREARAQMAGQPVGLGQIQPFETMEVMGLTEDFALICRRRARPDRKVIAKVIELLGGVQES
jgi:DNA-binding transcriptional MerR regulator